MADDIVDAAQKAINDAAKNAGGASPVSPTPPSVPSEPHPEPLVTQAPEPKPEAVIADPTPAPQPEPAKPPEENKSMDPAKEAVVSELLGTATVAPPQELKPEEKTQSNNPPLPPKKKSVSGFVMAVLATIMLTIPVAVYYVSQQNQQIADVRSRATGTNPYVGLGGTCQNTGQCSGGNICADGLCRDLDCDIHDPNACGGNPGACHCANGNDCTITRCENLQVGCIGDGRVWTENEDGIGMTCCERGYIANPNGDGCVPGGGGGCTGNNCGGGNPSPTPTPVAPLCQNLKIYKGGAQVTPNTLSPGDEVVLAVKGNLAPTKARFRVNGGAFQETTTKNAANEFTLNYTIPDGITSFVIEAEVFTNGAYH